MFLFFYQICMGNENFYLNPKLLNTGVIEIDSNILSIIEVIAGNTKGLITGDGKLDIYALKERGKGLGLFNRFDQILCCEVRKAVVGKNTQSSENISSNTEDDGSENKKLNELTHFFQTNLKIFNGIKNLGTFNQCSDFIRKEFQNGVKLSIFALNSILNKCIDYDECDIALTMYKGEIVLDDYTRKIIKGKCQSLQDKSRFHKKYGNGQINKSKSIGWEVNPPLDLNSIESLKKIYGKRFSEAQIAELHILITKEGFSIDLAINTICGTLGFVGSDIKSRKGGKFTGKK